MTLDVSVRKINALPPKILGMARPGRPTLPPDKAKRVREGMKNVLAEGRTSADLAKAVGVSPSAVSQILSGKNAASYQTAEAVARLLGVSAEELLGGEPASDSASPRDAAIRWARAAGYPEEVIMRATRTRRGPALTHDAWMDRLRSYKSEYDAGIVEEQGETPAPEDLSEPRRKR